VAIEHVIVLCLENRSFDHMLGFLEHPDGTFNGLLRNGPHTNPRSTGEQVPATPDGKAVLPYGPDHSHNAVMQQLALTGSGKDAHPAHQGFVTSYELKAAGRSPSRRGGVIGWVLDRLRKQPSTGTEQAVERGPLVMRCQPPSDTPVLSTLAREFAVCDNWFCSVPGETWPNRNYLHAASSDGETDINVRFYYNRTIFELLEEDADHDWRIYHDDVPQILAFPNLWDTPTRHAKWFPFEDFEGHVRNGDLPAYTFIEPHHSPPRGLVNDLASEGASTGRSNSQHPENNLVTDGAYDDFDPDIDVDFDRGERLIATIYQHLRDNPELFAKTLLLVTYDEHGGLYDHAPAPQRVENPGRLKPRLIDRVKSALINDNARRFDFSRVAVRVPTVVVSPLIEPGTVEHGFLEHASVPATLRAIFAPQAPHLSRREEHAGTFHQLCTRSTPRSDVPDLSQYAGADARRMAEPVAAQSAPEPVAADQLGNGASDWIPPYYREFLAQADRARRHLQKLGEPEVEGMSRPRTRHGGTEFTATFNAAAERHRAEVAEGPTNDPGSVG
jgi:phospholipase C